MDSGGRTLKGVRFFLKIIEQKFVLYRTIVLYLYCKNTIMEFEFAKYTEITDYAFERNPMYKDSGYSRLFICPDVWDFQLIRVLPGFNEEYEPDERKILVEHNMIPMDRKVQKLTISKLNEIIDDDDFSNYDYFEFNSMEKVIESISDIFGILNLKEELV